MIRTTIEFVPPQARIEIRDTSLTRPDWTKPENRGRSLSWLDRNENADPMLEDLVAQIVRDLPPDTFRLYPDYAPVYAKLAQHIGVQPDNLLFGGGSDGIIRAVFDAYVERDECVVLPDPTFGMYPVYCQIAGAKPVFVHYRPSAEGPVLDVDEFVRAIVRARPKLVCLPNPDSPTGTVLPETSLRRIIEAAGHAGALILIDEAYYPFYDATVVPWIGDYPHLVVARTGSKAWGIAGFRLGFAIADESVMRFLQKVRPNYSVTTPALAVFGELLDRYNAVLASVERLKAGKAVFRAAMQASGLRTLPSEGNFIHVAFGAHAPQVHEALANLVAYRQDFAQPALKGFSRFSITTAERFQPVIDRIRSALGAK